MPVTVRLPSLLARAAGGQAVHRVPAETVGAAVTALAGRYPELGPRLRAPDGQPYPYVLFYLDGEDVRFQQGFDTPAPDGAEIVVVPAMAGG